MSEASANTQPAAPSAMSVLGTLLLVLAGIVALITVDTALAGLDRTARRSEAAHLVRDARQLVTAGRAREAAARFRTALSLDRGNRDYRLELAGALAEEGRLTEADSILIGILRDDATDGQANLALAEVLAREGRVPEATSYYHRAIYGQWPEHPSSNRTRARVELIELLARAGMKQDLLAELLPLEATGIPDTALRRRVGHLFVRAGAAARGATIFRELMRSDGHSADSYAGLAEADFALGNYYAAEANFRTAAHLEPGNRETASRLEFVEQVLALDPTLRRLAAAERERRSAALLQLALEAAERCRRAGPADTAGALIDSARTALTTAVPASRLDRAAEAKLDLAERIRSRDNLCAEATTGRERVLDLILERLSD